MTAKSGWHSEMRVIEEGMAIRNFLDFLINRKSAREELMCVFLQKCLNLSNNGDKQLVRHETVTQVCTTVLGTKVQSLLEATFLLSLFTLIQFWHRCQKLSILEKPQIIKQTKMS